MAAYFETLEREDFLQRRARDGNIVQAIFYFTGYFNGIMFLCSCGRATVELIFLDVRDEYSVTGNDLTIEEEILLYCIKCSNGIVVECWFNDLHDGTCDQTDHF